MGLAKCAIEIVKWIPVVFISCLVIWSYYVYVIELCILTIDSILQKLAYILIFHVFFVMFTWSYLKTILTSPAVPTKQFRLTPDQIIQFNDSDTVEKASFLKLMSAKLPMKCKNFDGSPRFCLKCNCFKPDRSHHCSTCGTCILKMDHHCPWVNNCVNFSNYKFFVLFLAYALIYCLWIGITSLQYFVVFWKGMVNRSDASTTTAQGQERSDGSTIQIVFLTMVGFMFSISVVSLLAYHLYLVSKNKSTLEAFRVPMFQNGHQDKKAYDVGCKPNFVQIFGKRYLTALLPIHTSLGDGQVYNVNTATALYISTNYRSTDDIETSTIATSGPTTTTSSAATTTTTSAAPATTTTTTAAASNNPSRLSSATPSLLVAKISNGDGEIFQTRQVEEMGRGLLGQSYKDSSDSEH